MSAPNTKKAHCIGVIRFAFFCYFGYLSLVLLGIVLRGLYLGFRPSQPGVINVLFLVVCGFVFGVASWLALMEWKSEKVRGRRWLIGASLLSLCVSVSIPLIYGHSSGVNTFWDLERFFLVPQMIGVVGLSIFSRRPIPPVAEPSSISGAYVGTIPA